MAELNYVWQFDTLAPPEAIWARMADTNRFNRDTGIPSLNPLVMEQRGLARHLGFRFFGMPVEWDEEPFEWVRPRRFAVVRRYTTSPLQEITIRVELDPRAGGGTHITYTARVTPRNVIGTLAVPIQIGYLTRRGIGRAVKQYDADWAEGLDITAPGRSSEIAPGARRRLEAARDALRALSFEDAAIGRLFSFIEFGDEIALARIRPFVLADEWKLPRKELLELCLHAARLGVLDLEWDLLCPLCRGASKRLESLGEVHKDVHCPSCNIDYAVNFDRSVELTFSPNAAVRQVDTRVYCVGGPQVTPHIYAQQILPPHGHARIAMPLEAGRYRLRTPQKRGGKFLFASPEGAPEVVLRAGEENWEAEESEVSLEPRLVLENATPQEQVFILERWAWSDQSVTAADVTALQTFRDLFANEALRSGEQFSIGGLTLVFTDLKRSTALYQEIGDAPAFGRVLNHFEVVREAVAAEEGAVVKTMGDAVMAVFRRPVNAVRAMERAQSWLAHPPDGMLPLALKVGIHAGACIAVTLNGRLDYFGTNVNIASRVAGLSDGTDILLSESVRHDPEVERYLDGASGTRAKLFETQLRGFQETFRLWRIEQDGSSN